MQQTEELGFIHKWVPAKSGDSHQVTLLLLHGPGGDENALLSVGNELWPGVALLGLRGKMLENGMPTSFRRFTEVGIDHIKSRTEELARFIDAASKTYDFSRRRLIVVGYSNGANLAASLILFHPHYLGCAVLFRVMVPLVPDLIRDFSHLAVFIGAARLDPLIPTGQPEELAALFNSGGADVTISWHQGGRELGDDDVQAAMIRFDWTAMDGWFEEDEEVFVHPHDPYTRIDILHSARHVEVEVNGVKIADTHRPTLLFETRLPTRYYIPKLDVRMDLLIHTDTVTGCAYTGFAEYWSACAGSETIKDLAWSYKTPLPENVKIAGLVAFYNGRANFIMDGVRQARPKTRFS